MNTTDKELLDVLIILENFLSDDRWGTYQYMEGAEVGGDIAKHLALVQAAIAKAKEEIE